MSVSQPKWILRFACCCALAGSAAGWQTTQPGAIKRLYVESFVTKVGAEELREDVIAELRKISSISLVSGASSADAILGGGARAGRSAHTNSPSAATYDNFDGGRSHIPVSGVCKMVRELQA